MTKLLHGLLLSVLLFVAPARAQYTYSVVLEDSSPGLTVGIITADVIYIENPTLPYVSFPSLLNVVSLEITGNAVMTNASVPALKAHTGPNNFNIIIDLNPVLDTVNLNALISSSGSISMSQNPSLTTVLLSNLVFVRVYLSFINDDALVTLALPSLVSVATFPFNGLSASGCANLANVSLPKYLPTKGRPQSFDGCALTQASVDHVLARCVAATGYTSGTVNLSGGTSASPSAAGLADKATLIARGCTVLTN